MIGRYKVCMAGPYHIAKNIPCQDAYSIRDTKEGAAVAVAVADGLGIDIFSDVGAKVASSSGVTHCAKHYVSTMSDEEVITLMREAFKKAYENVVKVATRAGNDLGQYDTTLCLAIYDGEKLYFGQSGDSGLVAVTRDGIYHPVTTQQRDDEGNVYPLCFETLWEFGKVENVASAMLMTDGIWEQICDPLLRFDERKINVSLAELFMNHYGLSDNEMKQMERAVYKYMRNFPSKLLDDDKTMVVLINSDASPNRLDDDYYKVPDWDTLAEKAKKYRYSF